MKRRIISLVLVLALMIGAAVRPQRADAVALTATVVAASAAAILTACGVSYWAASQNDAVDYISGKLEDYLSSIEETDTPADWLGISAAAQPFTIITGGSMQFASGIANKLLDFCRWFVTNEGIESGGEAIGNASLVELQSEVYSPYNSNYSGSADIEAISANEVKININGIKTESASSICVQSYIPCVAGQQIRATIKSGNYSQSVYYEGTIRFLYQFDSNLNAGTASMTVAPSSVLFEPTRDTFLLRYVFPYSVSTTPLDGFVIIEFSTSDLGNPNTATVTPSDFVNIPANVEDGAYFALTPNVNLASGDSVDTASQAILDGITSEDGLSSTVEDTPSSSWSWLYTLLVNIAEAITDGVADIKQAVLGLADSIYNKFTTVLQDIKTGITTIVNSISSAVSQLLSVIQDLPTTIYNQFSQVLQDIKTGIQGIALDIYTDVINALTYVFVPSQAFIDTYVASLYATFDNHFSILSYPFSILGEFITRASGIGSPEPVFTWGNIIEPFSGKLLVSAGSYNLNSMLSNQTFAYVYQLYLIVVKGYMSFWFLTYLYNWFCDVFKMREADYSPPEVEDI